MRRQRAKTEMIHARIEPKLKRSAQDTFSQIGISTTEAVRLFLGQVELHQGLPFPVSIPNEETIAAMTEANSPPGLKRFRSFHNPRKNRGTRYERLVTPKGRLVIPAALRKKYGIGESTRVVLQDLGAGMLLTPEVLAKFGAQETEPRASASGCPRSAATV
jgi:DNA-damage-inducible protein J